MCNEVRYLITFALYETQVKGLKKLIRFFNRQYGRSLGVSCTFEGKTVLFDRSSKQVLFGKTLPGVIVEHKQSAYFSEVDTAAYMRYLGSTMYGMKHQAETILIFWNATNVSWVPAEDNARPAFLKILEKVTGKKETSYFRIKNPKGCWY